MAALADTQAIALLTRRAPSTIRSWAARSLLTRRGTMGARALYDVDEAQKLAAEIDAKLAAWAAMVETPLTLCNTERASGSMP